MRQSRKSNDKVCQTGLKKSRKNDIAVQNIHLRAANLISSGVVWGSHLDVYEPPATK